MILILPNSLGSGEEEKKREKEERKELAELMVLARDSSS